MLKVENFRAKVGKVTQQGKVMNILLFTSRNGNMGKKKQDGSWEDANWVDSAWFATFFGDEAKKIGVGDILTITKASLTKELYEHDEKKDYPLKLNIFDGNWSWKSKGKPKSGKTESKEDKNDFDPEDSIPF